MVRAHRCSPEMGAWLEDGVQMNLDLWEMWEP
jgi:hypothetical protein